MLRIITLKIDPETLLLLERYAHENGITRSAVIRQAINYYIENHPEKFGLTKQEQDNKTKIRHIKIEIRSTEQDNTDN